jgi:hypothetical protein
MLFPIRYFAICIALVLMVFISQILEAKPSAAGPQQSGFNFARYKPVDLDELIGRKRPVDGADLYPGVPVAITGKLESYGQPCSTGFLKRTMVMGRMWDDAVPITLCIKIRTAKNKIVPLFIQDRVAEFLPKEIPLGGAVAFFAVHMFTSPDQIGLLVNEFSGASAVKN